MTAHDFTRFFTHLARTGNFALAATLTGRGKSVFYKHRAANPAFATRCEAALALFRATAAGAAVGTGGLKTIGGELHLHASRARPPQLRRAQPGRLTPHGIAAFLRALSATANIRLAAHGVGVAPSSVHARRRRDPEFAKAWDEALALGTDRLQLALITRAADYMEGRDPAAPDWEDDGLDPDAPGAPTLPIAPMTVDDVLRLLSHHTTKKRRAQAPYKRRPTMEELGPGMLRKAKAIMRMREES